MGGGQRGGGEREHGGGVDEGLLGVHDGLLGLGFRCAGRFALRIPLTEPGARRMS